MQASVTSRIVLPEKSGTSISPPSSTATVTEGVSCLCSFGLGAESFAGGWSGRPEKSVVAKSARAALSAASRFLYAACISRGATGTSLGTSRYGRTCSAMRLKTGAATCPPSCCPSGQSRQRPRAMQYNAFHKLPKCRRCLRADDAPGLCRRQDAFRRQRLVTAPQFRNHVRLIEQAAIRYRGDGASQLDRRHTD